MTTLYAAEHSDIRRDHLTDRRIDGHSYQVA
jgi:hypothetical protein